MAKQRTSRPDGGQSTTRDASMSASGTQGQDEGMVDQAKDKVHELADKAEQKAGSQLRASVSTGKNRAADALGSVAQSLLHSSQELCDQDRKGVGRYVERAANRVDQLADYVQNTDTSQMVDGVERFARREPALFLGGVFALGFLGARFLKSSRRGEMQQQAGARPYASSQARQWSSNPLPPLDRELPPALPLPDQHRAHSGPESTGSLGSARPDDVRLGTRAAAPPWTPEGTDSY